MAFKKVTYKALYGLLDVDYFFAFLKLDSSSYNDLSSYGNEQFGNSSKYLYVPQIKKIQIAADQHV